jgi:transcriptional regulator of acetoin/glycerol metabolism
LDSHEVRPVGGSTIHKADVRLIFASGTKMKKLILEEKMRKDFYYRLTSGIILSLPALRENSKKIREICLKFENDNYCVFSEELINYYGECSWPGNIRQLISHLTKKQILANGKKIILDKSDHDLMTDKISTKHFESYELIPLEQVKMDYCYDVYIKAEQNISKASKILEVSPNTLKAMLVNREKFSMDLRNHEVSKIDV